MNEQPADTTRATQNLEEITRAINLASELARWLPLYSHLGSRGIRAETGDPCGDGPIT